MKLYNYALTALVVPIVVHCVEINCIQPTNLLNSGMSIEESCDKLAEYTPNAYVCLHGTRNNSGRTELCCTDEWDPDQVALDDYGTCYKIFQDNEDANQVRGIEEGGSSDSVDEDDEEEDEEEEEEEEVRRMLRGN